jgi:hypothetical protein
MSYLAPGATAISEFARQQSGTWLNGTCVEASALMCAMALSPARFQQAPAGFGDYLQQMVNEWRAEFPADVSPNGASNFVDAADWLRDQGLSALDDVLPSVPDGFAEMQQGIPAGNVYLVGVTNAQALPGDEPGVHNHGLCAFGVDDAGNILCGDPDNWRANVNMPGNPVGEFVTYTRADFSNAAISSLTKVWGGMLDISQVSGFFTALSDTAWSCKQNGFVVQDGLLAAYRSWPAQGTLAGLTALGLPLENFKPAGPGRGTQTFERGTLHYDPVDSGTGTRALDNPPGASGPVYIAHVNHPAPPGQSPADLAAAKADAAAAHKALADYEAAVARWSATYPKAP